MSIDNSQHYFLENGGEMGQIIRATDWSTTPLGDPGTWPQPLKTMVSVMLNNPLAMYIAWGKEHTQIYNDGYRPILGMNKHPKALGISTAETFGEIWDSVQPMFNDVMTGKAICFNDYMVPIDRNGYIENCYFDSINSPIKLESGAVGGILVTITETTSKKKAENDLEDNKHALEFIIEASQLGTFEYNPITNELSSNQRLKTLLGISSDSHVLEYALSTIVKEDRAQVAHSIKHALQYASGGYYDMEYSIVNPISEKEFIIHAKGKAWFNEDKIAYRLNGTLEDVTERVMAAKKIEESERSLKLMILQAPVAISIFRGTDYKVEIANKYALELWGRTEEEILNISVFESMPELLSQGIKEFLSGVSTTGKRFSITELPLQFMKNGRLETVFVNFSYEALYDNKGKINGIMAIGYDITPQIEARKKIEESAQYIRTLVDSAPFPIGVFVGIDMRISLANQAIMDAWGKGNDVIGKLYSEILPELENQHIFKQIRSVFNTGIPFHARNQKVEIIINGELKSFYYNYSFTPLLDVHGKVHSVMNTAAEVTELNEAKHKVEESEKRFRDAVIQAPLGIAILRGPENLVDMANKNYLQLVDKTEQQFIGKPIFEVLPEAEEVIAPIFAEIYRTGEAFYGYEFPVNLNRHGKTEISYFNFVYHPLKETNSITGIMVVATEVTATINAKHQIEENEEKLKLIIEGSELGVFDVNLKSLRIIASDRCYEILGFSEKKDLSNEDLIANIHPEDLEMRLKELNEAYITGVLHHELRVFWEDESLHWIEVKGKVYFDDQNQPDRLLGTVRDITEEKTFQQQLLEREEKFRLLADSMPQQVWTADPEGNLTYFNKTVFDYSGLSLEELISMGWLNMVHPDDREDNIEQWNEAINSGKDFLTEHRFRSHNGDYRWQLSRASPQKDVNGTIKMWVGSSTDIQEQKMFTTELENKVQLRTNELQQKNIDLEKMNRELQSFVYISSHDLQEPLRKIQTFSSRIIETEYATLSHTAKKYFSRMQKSAFRMQNLIQDLIAYSRTNVQESNYETVHLNAVIEDVLETLSEELEENDVTFNLLHICEIKIIPVQFTQVIHNLISNSIKFAKADHPIHIEIDCKIVKGNKTGIEALANNKHYCHIRYTDNGIGFEPQYKEKIFEVFQRLHSKDDYTGTGIGLAIVKKIIDNHEGIIIANGKLNEGATFDIYIPV